MTNYPLITVVIPCRNESKYIQKCLDSIISCDYPKEKLEVFVVDGFSEDGCRDIISKYASKYSYITLLDNPKKILAASWNIGIKKSSGDFICSMNSHGTIHPHMFTRLIEYHQRYDVACVAPTLITCPQDETFFGKAVSLVFSHPFGVGNSRFRVGVATPQLADTCHIGMYRKKIYDKIGYYNESLIRSQDIEFHGRLVASGNKILLIPDVKFYYYTRSTPSTFIKDSLRNGFWTTYPYGFGVVVARMRHLVPLFFLLTLTSALTLSLFWQNLLFLLILIITIYIIPVIISSSLCAIQKRSIKYVLLLPILFISYHILYGIGSLFGLAKAITKKQFWTHIQEIVRLYALLRKNSPNKNALIV